MSIFAVSYSAQDERKSVSGAMGTSAINTDEAVGRGIAQSKREFSVDNGWFHHQAVAVELPKKWLLKELENDK